MDASRIHEKKLRFHKFPDTCGRSEKRSMPESSDLV